MCSRFLQLHSDSNAGFVEAIQVEVALHATGALKLTYVLTGDLNSIRLPPPQLSGRADGLWRHTCFEAFIRSSGSAAYREFNFSPSSHWQAYDFTDRRVGGLLEPAADPQIDCSTESGRLTLTATIQSADLPPGNTFHIGLTAVVESAGSDLAYWALYHAVGKPDFHHPDTFTLELELT